MKKKVGKVTEDEKREILEINAHKNALEELLMILPRNTAMYARAMEDLHETSRQYQGWWNAFSDKYHWEKGKGNWRIIFDTNEIVIEL